MQSLNSLQDYISDYIKQRKKDKIMELINKAKAVWEWFDGKKTFIVAIIGAVTALLVASGVNIPDWVWLLLSALGLGSLRSAVGKTTK